jgi:hypothetical protein
MSGRLPVSGMPHSHGVISHLYMAATRSDLYDLARARSNSVGRLVKLAR